MFTAVTLADIPNQITKKRKFHEFYFLRTQR